jgi:crooked neck
LADYQLRKRKAFEDELRKNRSVITNWIKYAKWEESQKELQRYSFLAVIMSSVFMFWLFSGLAQSTKEHWTLTTGILLCGLSILKWRCEISRSTMREIFGTELSPSYPALINFGTSIPTWRKWSAILRVTICIFIALFALLEQILLGCRQVFERWMEWEPDEQAWQTYINFELRYKEIDRARHIYERFVMIHPEVKHWIKYAR